MPRRMTVAQFENQLVALQASIAMHASGNTTDVLFEGSFPMRNEEIELVRKALEKLGLYDQVRKALTDSEQLAREGKFSEAEDLILETNKALMKASGSYERMQRALIKN